MKDYSVTVIQDQHVPDFVPGKGLVTRTRVGIMIGGLGPYYKDFDPPNDTAIDINQWKQSMVDRARSVQGA
jgi:hypothetical protein